MRRALASMTWLTASNYVASGLAVVRGVVLAATLGPAGYGAWGLISTFQGWSQFADAGVSQVSVREMPRFVGRGDVGGAQVLAGTSMWWNLGVSAVCGLLAAYGWQFGGWPDVPGRRVLFPAVFMALGLFNVAGQVGRAFFSFRRVAIVTIVAGVLGLGFGYTAAVRFGLGGLLVSQASVYSLAALLLLGGAGLREVIRGPDRSALRRSLATGWSLLLPPLGMHVFVSMDMLVAGVLLGAAQTGIYAVALLSSSMVAGMVSGSVGSVAGQYVLRESGMESRNRKPREAMVWGPAAGMAAVLAPACAIAAVVGPALVRMVLPEYLGAALPMQLLLIASYFLYSQSGFSTTLVATGRQMSVVPLLAVLGAANVAIDVVLVGAGMGIVGVAVGTLTVNVVFAAVHMVLIGRAMQSAHAKVRLQAAMSMAAGLLPTATVLAANGTRVSGGGGGGGYWIVMAVAAVAGALGLVAWIGLIRTVRTWSAELAAGGAERIPVAA